MKKFLYSQIPGNRTHDTPCRATWGTSQEAEEVRGKYEQKPLSWFPWQEGVRQEGKQAWDWLVWILSVGSGVQALARVIAAGG